MSVLALCAVGGMVSLYVVATNFAPPPPPPPPLLQQHRLDSAEREREWGRGAEILLAEERPGELADPGTTRVPGFPRRLCIPQHQHQHQHQHALRDGTAGDEYVLVGHGIRTVSFLRVQVYVVGLYVHIDDLPVIERRLQRPQPPPPPPVEEVPTPTPTTPTTPTTPPSPPHLPSAALAPPVRSMLRITPVRNTDWAHLRDGFVRAILSHQPQPQPTTDINTNTNPNTNTNTNTNSSDGNEEDFAHALHVFKGLFNPRNSLPRSVPAGAPLYLLRGPAGELRILYESKGGLVAINAPPPPPPPPTATAVAATAATAVTATATTAATTAADGVVRDTRISSALWSGYIGGGKVASEQLRDRVWKRLEALGRGEGTRE